MFLIMVYTYGNYVTYVCIEDKLCIEDNVKVIYNIATFIYTLILWWSLELGEDIGTVFYEWPNFC